NHGRSRQSRNELRDGMVGHRIEANPHQCDLCRRLCDGHVYLLPCPDGVLLSNCFWSKFGMGIFGNSGAALGGAAESTIVGVTITISSELVLLIDRDRNSCPRMGISPIPGTLENCAVTL